MADFPMSQNSTPEQEQGQQTSSSNRFFIPLILSFSSHPRTDQTDQDQETNRSSDHVVTISFFHQDMMMIPSLKDGPLPASKASIEAMPKIEITEKDQGDGECSICLEGWKIGEVVKEMPCKHQYHSNCIEKWLGIHGSCPVCRFKMPLLDEEESKKEERGTRVERELSDQETLFVMNLLRLFMPSNNNNNQEN